MFCFVLAASILLRDDDKLVLFLESRSHRQRLASTNTMAGISNVTDLRNVIKSTHQRFLTRLVVTHPVFYLVQQGLTLDNAWETGVS